MAKVLIVGGGGREHAIGWSIGQSDEVSEVLYAPGNGGTEEGKGLNVAVDGTKKENFPALADLIEKESIDITVVGPEAPLAQGLVDYLKARGYGRVFGPSETAAQLESDKFFSYEVVNSLGIPQADSVKCSGLEEATAAISDKRTVLKARGLTSGKGVLVCDSKKEALAKVEAHIAEYGRDVLVAERLVGEEFSVFGISDGDKVYPFDVSIQDYKPLLDGNRGPNTGGMGAYGPAAVGYASYVVNAIMTPVVRKMKKEGHEYKGFLYAGMMSINGRPYVIEFNARLGDPEAQPLMMLIDDLYSPLSLALESRLDEAKLNINPGAACCVVLAAPGYPENPRPGFEISGVEAANKINGIKVFHAGTKLEGGKLISSGGRILGVTAYSPNGIADARALAYKGVAEISVDEGFHYRTDIAQKALEK